MEEAIEVLETESGRRSHVCAVCGEAFSEDEMLKVKDVNGNDCWMCADCAVEWEGDKSRDVRLWMCGDCHEFYMTSLTSLEDDERGIRVCGECRDENWFQCADCGEWFRAEDDMRKAWEIYDDGEDAGSEVSLCEGCFESNARQCADCGEWCWPADNMNTYDGDAYCGDCWENDFTTCERCGETVRRNETYTVHVTWRCEEEWCEDCVANHAFTCDSCGERFYDDFYHSYGDDCETFCEDCWDNMDHDDGVIWDYSHKPRPEFHGNPEDGEPYMGVELEAGGAERDRCNNAADWIDGNVSSGLLYLKHDGSITDCGFEMVTHPCTLQYHEESFPWCGVLRTCMEEGLKSHDLSEPHGLHVHLSRECLDERLWRLLDAFVNINREDIARLARRGSNHYCKYSLDEAPGTVSSRYRPVNFCNENTIELRFFRGSLIENTLLACLGVAHSLWKVLHMHGEKYIPLLPEEFNHGHRPNVEYADAARLMLEDWTDMICEDARYARSLEYMRSRGAFPAYFGRNLQDERKESAAE